MLQLLVLSEVPNFEMHKSFEFTLCTFVNYFKDIVLDDTFTFLHNVF